jgi:hypothetical protein
MTYSSFEGANIRAASASLEDFEVSVGLGDIKESCGGLEEEAESVQCPQTDGMLGDQAGTPAANEWSSSSGTSI